MTEKRKEAMQSISELLKQGKSRKEIESIIKRDRRWISKIIKDMRTEAPELLKGTAEEISKESPKQTIKNKAIKSLIEEKPEKSTNEQKQAENEQNTKEKAYLRLDVTDNKEYIRLMAERLDISMTGYINRLINLDKEQNEKIYQKLLAIEEMKRGL